MPCRYWIIIISLGLALTSNAVAQQTVDSEAQGQPTPQSERGDQSSESSAGEDQGPDIVPAPQGIEDAIIDLVEEFTEAPSDQEERERRDLDAQEAMAKWAFWMFVASAVTVTLTGIALIAIILTLRHTRRAADSSEKMVVEAKETTKAAEDSVAETKRIGEAQAKAYLGFQIVSGQVAEGEPISFKVRIKNHGASPALAIAVASCAVVRRADWQWDEESEMPDVDDAPSLHLHPGGHHHIFVKTDPPVPLDSGHVNELRTGRSTIFVNITVYFRDVFSGSDGDRRIAQLRFEFSGEHCFSTREPRIAAQGNFST